MTAVGRRGTCRFQSTLLMRGATAKVGVRCKTGEFQSTLLMRGATRRRPGPAEALHHFNPRSSCEERRFTPTYRDTHSYTFQSTLLMRGATTIANVLPLPSYFNPRSSCEERPPLNFTHSFSYSFQSTLLMRGATRLPAHSCLPIRDFNPRSSCEERRRPAHRRACRLYFNPRSSCEERHVAMLAWFGVGRISIHAPHARSDDTESYL